MAARRRRRSRTGSRAATANQRRLVQSIAGRLIRSTAIREQAHDALVLLDVPAVLIVVSGDRDRTHLASARLPDARTGHCSPVELRSRAAQFVELDLHSSQYAVELRDVSGSAVVRSH